MRRTASALGKAFFYFMVYAVVSFAVSIGTMSMLMSRLAQEMTGKGHALDEMALTMRAAEEMEKYTAPVLLISGILTLLSCWIICSLRNKRLSEEVCLRRIDKKGVLPLLALGMILNIAVSFFMQVLPLPQSWMESYAESTSVLSGGNIIMQWVSNILIAPVMEEMIFRGFVYTRLKRGMPIWLAAILSAVLFGAMHGNLLWSAYTCLFGVLLVWCFERYGSLAASILLHMAFNTAGEMLFLLPALPAAVIWIAGALSFILVAVLLIWIRKQTDFQKQAAL